MTEKEKNSIPVDLITRYLSGEANTDDIIDLERWKAASEENLRTFDQYRSIWEATGRLTIFTDIDIDIDHEWETFLNSTSEDTQPDENKSSVKFMPLLLRVAAVMVIGLLLSYSVVFLYHTFSYEKISAITGKVSVDLPDGTVVSLNRGAVLEFPRKFDAVKRNVRLDGEAFFNVKRDITRPFTVQSGNFVLQVLGTSFNLQAYKKKNTIEVVVATGEVEVYPRNKEEQRQIISPGQKGIFSRKSREIYKTSNTDPNFNAWNTGIIHFRDASVEEVAAVIKNVYGKDVVVNISNSKNCRITVTFDNASLEYFLKTIGETLNLKVQDKDGVFYLTGPGC